MRIIFLQSAIVAYIIKYIVDEKQLFSILLKPNCETINHEKVMKKIIGIILGCLLLSSCYPLREGIMRGDGGIYTTREDRKKALEKAKEERRKQLEWEREQKKKEKQRIAEERRKEAERRRR